MAVWRTAPLDLHRLPLDRLHRAASARMAPFAGYDMPLNYTAGIIAEHHQVRRSAGLFDASHMGQIVLGPLPEAAAALEALVPADIAALAPGRQRYTLLTDRDGGILDDLMVANLGDRLLLIVNAGRKAADEARLRAHLPPSVEMTALPDRALLALQGPQAAEALAELAPDVADLRFMDVASLPILGAEAIVSRSGYTGEDGFEISLDEAAAEAVATALLADRRVLPAGLGARDSLRLEAGLPLYGIDLDEGTSPVEADLGWSIPRSRRPGGARPGGFPGATRILAELASGPARRRVGLKIEGRQPVRGGAPLFIGSRPLGHVTSGGFGPTLDAPVAMALIDRDGAAPGTRLEAEVRGRRIGAVATPLPFVPHRYRRR